MLIVSKALGKSQSRIKLVGHEKVEDLGQLLNNND
jgi:hypothetical protein